MDADGRGRSLTIDFAGAFRRSELVALQCPDMTEPADGLRMLGSPQQRRTRRGEARKSKYHGLARRPVEALQRLQAADVTTSFHSALRAAAAPVGISGHSVAEL
jgi:hypothetical protein